MRANEAWKQAASAAAEGARRTADMTPKLCRASYLDVRALGTQDGGAAAVVSWMEALAKNLLAVTLR